MISLAWGPGEASQGSRPFQKPPPRLLQRPPPSPALPARETWGHRKGQERGPARVSLTSVWGGGPSVRRLWAASGS